MSKGGGVERGLSLPDAGSHTLSLVGSLPDVVRTIPRREESSQHVRSGEVSFRRMNLPLEQRYLYVQDQPVLSLAEFQSYAYGLPETAVVPDTLTRWVAGEPGDLS